MPTPFQHLHYGQTILDSRKLPATVRERLLPGAFLLGNTAADVQSITGQPRPVTHFFGIPPTGKPRAEVAMLETYPQLADPRLLATDHAAFISGYLVHLVYDQRWASDIYCLHYGCAAANSDWLGSAIEHNALRVLLDRQAEAALRSQPWVLRALRSVTPGSWLPFADAKELQAWQTWIVEQLTQPGASQTAEVFAARYGVPVERLELATHRLYVQESAQSAPAALRANAQYETQALDESMAMLRRYWHCEPGPDESEFDWLADFATVTIPTVEIPPYHGRA